VDNILRMVYRPSLRKQLFLPKRSPLAFKAQRFSIKWDKSVFMSWCRSSGTTQSCYQKEKSMQITYVLIPVTITTPPNTALPTLPVWISLLMWKDTQYHYIKWSKYHKTVWKHDNVYLWKQVQTNHSFLVGCLEFVLFFKPRQATISFHKT